jgi:hypothetical protein
LPLVDAIVLCVGDRRARVPLLTRLSIEFVGDSIGAMESCIAFEARE